jgi:hypothetical protein
MTDRSERPRDSRGRYVSVSGGGRAAAPKQAKRGERPKKANWPKRKEEVFFRELGILCNVSSALRAAGLAGRSGDVYEWAQTDPAFLAKWDQALAASYRFLALEMSERGRRGDDRPAPQTEVEKRLRSVPNSVGLAFLKLHYARANAAPSSAPAHYQRRRFTRERSAQIRRELDEMLADLNRRMGGED